MHRMILLVPILLLAVACNGAAPGTPAPGTPAPAPGTPVPTEPGPAEPTAEAVSIVDQAFDPATLSISVGTQVSWTNNGQLPHTVTFDDGTGSGNLSPGATFEETFDEAGTFSYICSIHPQMQGVVTVGP